LASAPRIVGVSAHNLREIQQLIEAALARHGTAGEVQVDERAAHLFGSGRDARVDIDRLIEKWDALPFPERHRECGLIARALAKQRRSLAPKARLEGRRPVSIVGVVAVALLTGGGVYAFGLRDETVEPDAASAHDALALELAKVERERDARAERVCNATRTRISRGGTIGPTDAEGWVVELGLLWSGAEALAQDLGDFIVPHGETMRVVWAGAPDLKKLEGPGTYVEVLRRTLPEDAAPQYRELRLTLRGEYVLPYFREPERIKLIRFAHALAERNSAMLGALYARCEAGTTHHMGSWFLGNSPGAAASALLYYMGAHAQPPLLPAEVLSTRQGVPLERAFALDTLLERTRRLERKDVASALGALDGMVAGPARFTTLGFPFVDSDRALRASFQLVPLLAAAGEAPR
jgi:hypothetical protein